MTENSIINAYNRGTLKNPEDPDGENPVRNGFLQNPDSAYNEDGEDSVGLANAKSAARTGMQGELSGSTNPIISFARLAAFFAGQQSFKMELKLKEYTAQHDEYKLLLEHSQEAHTGQAEAARNDGLSNSSKTFNYFFNHKVLGRGDGPVTRTNDKYAEIVEGQNDYILKYDKGNDSKHNKDEWGRIIGVINEKKDLESTDLNKLSTEMDMAVKDSDSAQQMAANAIKKSNDLMSTQAKSLGG